MDLTRKYAPKSFEELLADEKSKEKIKEYVDEKDVPHLLFYGPPGTGKTTTVDLIVKTFYGKSKDVFYRKINCSLTTGIDTIRERINDFVTHAPPFNVNKISFRICHLDEADSLSPQAQDSLRVLMDDHKATCRFLLTTNHVSKISPALKSRCDDIFFGPVPKEQVVDRLMEIVENEKFDDRISKDALISLYDRKSGDMRKILIELRGMMKVLSKNDGTAEELFGEEIDVSVVTTVLSLLKEGKMTTARSKLYGYFRETGVERRDFLWSLFKEILKKSDIENVPKGNIIKAIGECDLNIRDKTNDIIHVDVMLNKIMEEL